MSSVLSRVAVAAAGLPIVLFAAYYGGWSLLVVAALAALLALHELYQMARSLRPLVLAGYGGALAAVVGASLGGAEWMLGGFLLTLLLAFAFAAVSETRQSTTVAIATTLLGAAWIGLGLGHLVLPRDPAPNGSLTLVTVLHDCEHPSVLRFGMPAPDAELLNVREKDEGDSPLEDNSAAPVPPVDGGGIATAPYCA